ncbi:unnamed protein product [Caenorhabditis sp. 36 PRJEB53466]|nr:unnamed protein product [Caenorhabditis sp. 36 PRJEB53466]
MPRRYLLLLFCTAIIVLYINKVFIYDQLILAKSSFWSRQGDIREIRKDPQIYLRQVVQTHVGIISFIEFREELFKKFGYNLTIPTYPFVTLDFTFPVNCTYEFEDYLIQEKERTNRRPRAYIPDEDTKDFLLNKYSGVSYKYSDDRFKLNLTYKSWENIDDIVTWHARDVLRLDDDFSAISMHFAMKSYNIRGKRGIVLAGDHPITEVQAIQNGASRILSVGQPAHETEDITSMSLADFAENHRRFSRSFDFVASYGTIESFGLGRFGEVLNANGDLQVMTLLDCSLKSGGLFFLGLSIGRDAVIFNQKRIYGHARLPMLIAGFEWIGTFSEESDWPTKITARQINQLHKFDHFKRTLVLRKL